MIGTRVGLRTKQGDLIDSTIIFLSKAKVLLGNLHVKDSVVRLDSIVTIADGMVYLNIIHESSIKGKK